MIRLYRGFEIVRTGRASWDWRVSFPGRTRWGTLEELRSDVDAFLAGGLPSPKRGGA